MNRKEGELLTLKDGEIYCLYRLPYDDTSKTKAKPVSVLGRFNIVFSVQEDSEADLLKKFCSVNMEENSKFLKHRTISDLPQIATTP